MNKILTIITFLAGLITGHDGYAQTVVDSSYHNSHYKNRMDFFEQVPVRKKATVFVGNSITEAGDWSDILPEEDILNRGISGDISYGVLARLDKILAGKPSKVFLLIGVNDLKREIPNELIVQNYKKMVSRVKQKAPKTKLYLQGVLPINESLLIEPFKMVKMRDINFLNQALQEIAAENGVEYIDLAPVLADKQGQLKKEFTPDGIHLKPVAYIDWIGYLRKLDYL